MAKFLKKILGIILIIASFAAWGVIALLPFLKLSASFIAAFTVALVIVGEILFWLGLLIAGRPLWNKIKGFFSLSKSNQDRP